MVDTAGATHGTPKGLANAPSLNISRTRVQQIIGAAHSLSIAYLMFLYSGPINWGSDALLKGLHAGKFIIFAFIIVYFLSATPAKLVRAVTNGFWIIPPLAFFVFVALSSTWSVDEDQSLAVLKDLGYKTLFAIYLGFFRTPEELLTIVRRVFVAMVLVSLIGVAAGLRSIDGFSGAYSHKNWFGQTALVQSVTFLASALTESEHRSFWLLFSIIAFAEVLVSRTMGSVVIAVPYFTVCLTLILLSRSPFSLRIPALIGALMVVIPAVWVVFEFKNELFSLMGKSSNLTGRLPIWQSAPVLASPDNFWFGAGLAGFWTMENPTAVGMWRILGWVPPHAHNGFIDLFLNFGVVGAALWFTMWISFVIAAWKWLSARAPGSPLPCNRIWPLTIVLFLPLSNANETNHFQYLNWYLPLAVFLSVSISRATLNHAGTSDVDDIRDVR